MGRGSCGVGGGWFREEAPRCGERTIRVDKSRAGLSAKMLIEEACILSSCRATSFSISHFYGG